MTTLRDTTEEVLDFFVNYHLSIGFDHLFLFFDNPHDESYAKFLENNNITVFKKENLENLWKKTTSFEYHSQHVTQEVMSRQILNTEVAIKVALEMKLDWILHIDIDELFYCPNENVFRHFEKIENQGITSITYLNHEAFPESFLIKNYFEEVSLFKKNVYTLTMKQRTIIRSLHGNLKKHFNYYWKGKAAAKLNKNLLPNGVHRFQTSDQALITSSPCILHYSCCGYNNFITKYKTLGKFKDKWFDKTDIIKRIPVHLKARDIIAKGNTKVSEEFYKEVFMKQDRDKKQYLIKQGIYFRISPLLPCKLKLHES